MLIVLYDSWGYKMKKFFIGFFSFILILLIGMGLFLRPYILEYQDVVVSKDNSEVVVEIPKGISTKEIGVLLKNNGCIKSEYTFYLRVRDSEYATKLNYGTFTLRKNMTITEIIDILVNTHYIEEVETVKITFPEGYTIEQMAVLLEEKGIVNQEEFLSAVTEEYDYEFIKHIPDGEYKYKLQGFLFPATYEFEVDIIARDVVDKMLKTFEQRYGTLTDDYSNIFEIITKASVIEREAKLDNERFTISGVISNRLEKDMLLEIDACVLYPLTDGLYNKYRVLYADLEIDSLYNTYKYKGLPVGAICNPGIVSIEASLKPEVHEWLYYHTDEVKKDGSHIFTKTYEEHVNTMQY